jgi:hypothetical protein
MNLVFQNKIIENIIGLFFYNDLVTIIYQYYQQNCLIIKTNIINDNSYLFNTYPKIPFIPKQHRIFFLLVKNNILLKNHAPIEEEYVLVGYLKNICCDGSLYFHLLNGKEAGRFPIEDINSVFYSNEDANLYIIKKYKKESLRLRTNGWYQSLDMKIKEKFIRCTYNKIVVKKYDKYNRMTIHNKIEKKYINKKLNAKKFDIIVNKFEFLAISKLYICTVLKERFFKIFIFRQKDFNLNKLLKVKNKIVELHVLHNILFIVCNNEILLYSLFIDNFIHKINFDHGNIIRILFVFEHIFVFFDKNIMIILDEQYNIIYSGAHEFNNIKGLASHNDLDFIYECYQGNIIRYDLQFNF